MLIEALESYESLMKNDEIHFNKQEIEAHKKKISENKKALEAHIKNPDSTKKKPDFRNPVLHSDNRIVSSCLGLSAEMTRYKFIKYEDTASSKLDDIVSNSLKKAKEEKKKGNLKTQE